MTDRPQAPAVDPVRLSAYLRALGVPARVEMLRKLQVPRTIAELEVHASRASRDMSSERNISRQALEAHIDKLRELGFVHARAGRRDGRPATEYVVNHARLFVVVEELRRMSLVHSGGLDTEVADAKRQPAASPGGTPAGPALVLVGGPFEGRMFALTGAGPWTIGRDQGVAVSLPYDPFVSKETARVQREGPGAGRYALEPIPGARNATTLNWRQVEPGGRAPLQAGDVVGVGRSLLAFRGA